MNEVNRCHSFNKRSSATFFCLQGAIAILPLLTNCLTLFRYKLVLLWGYCHTPQTWWEVQLRAFSSSVISPYFISAFLELIYWKQRYFTAIDIIGEVEEGKKRIQHAGKVPLIEHKGRFQSPQLCFCSCSWGFNTSTRLTPWSLAEYIHTSSSWTKLIEGRKIK